MLVFESGRSYETPSRTLGPLRFLRQAGYQFFHTGWLKQAKGMSYLCGDDGDPDPQEKEVLALSPFEVETRFLRHDGMNIFACHSDRLGQLETLFQKRHFDSLTPLNV
jgi:hypothetical protein